MWRAESLKAGAGSRSKAAKPRPHTLVCQLPRCEHVVSACCWSGRWGWVSSPWEPKTWCNRCRPSCHALASSASLSCYPKAPPALPSPCGAKACSQNLICPGLHGIWAVLWRCSGWRSALPACVLKSTTPATFPSVLLHVLLSVSCWRIKIGCFDFFVVAAWLLV